MVDRLTRVPERPNPPYYRPGFKKYKLVNGKIVEEFQPAKQLGAQERDKMLAEAHEEQVKKRNKAINDLRSHYYVDLVSDLGEVGLLTLVTPSLGDFLLGLGSVCHGEGDLWGHPIS